MPRHSLKKGLLLIRNNNFIVKNIRKVILIFIQVKVVVIKSMLILYDKIKSGGAGSGIMHPYGYTSIEKKLVVFEEEAEVIKKIFQLCIDGNGTRKIANRLNELIIPTKTNKLFDKELKQKNGRMVQFMEF